MLDDISAFVWMMVGVDNGILGSTRSTASLEGAYTSEQVGSWWTHSRALHREDGVPLLDAHSTHPDDMLLGDDTVLKLRSFSHSTDSSSNLKGSYDTPLVADFTNGYAAMEGRMYGRIGGSQACSSLLGELPDL